MSAKEIADLFSMDEKEIKLVFTLYFAENGGLLVGETLPNGLFSFQQGKNWPLGKCASAVIRVSSLK